MLVCRQYNTWQRWNVWPHHCLHNQHLPCGGVCESWCTPDSVCCKCVCSVLVFDTLLKDKSRILQQGYYFCHIVAIIVNSGYTVEDFSCSQLGSNWGCKILGIFQVGNFPLEYMGMNGNKLGIYKMFWLKQPVLLNICSSSITCTDGPLKPHTGAAHYIIILFCIDICSWQNKILYLCLDMIFS